MVAGGVRRTMARPGRTEERVRLKARREGLDLKATRVSMRQGPTSAHEYEEYWSSETVRGQRRLCTRRARAKVGDQCDWTASAPAQRCVRTGREEGVAPGCRKDPSGALGLEDAVRLGRRRLDVFRRSRPLADARVVVRHGERAGSASGAESSDRGQTRPRRLDRARTETVRGPDAVRERRWPL